MVPQHPNISLRLFAFNIFTSTNRTPGLISRILGRNNQSLNVQCTTAHAKCERLTTTSVATVHWICLCRSWPKGLYGRNWPLPQHQSVMRLPTDVNMTCAILAIRKSYDLLRPSCTADRWALYWSSPSSLMFDIGAVWRSGLSARLLQCQTLKTMG